MYALFQLSSMVLFFCKTIEKIQKKEKLNPQTQQCPTGTTAMPQRYGNVNERLRHLHVPASDHHTVLT